eukprot:GHRR01021550.1.p1 GENE.GHRR01021550.1~~GHRR01021550.1.p1  ORF type:complete len:236 (+),score=20.41 GHRR01021550.1:138-845(+)
MASLGLHSPHTASVLLDRGCSSSSCQQLLRPGTVQRGRWRSVQTRCLYTLHQREPRCQLARRPALALSCAERSSATDLIGAPGQPAVQFSPNKRLRIAVDVDEVLGRFVYALNKFCREEFNEEYDISDYWVYEFAKIWHCSQDRSNHIVHEFFKSRHFAEGIPVIPGAFATLQRLSSQCELVVVTSRQHVIQDVTLDWIDKHYSGLFTEVYFGNHFALQGTSRKKSDICKWVLSS